jgi:hypothetical protein
METDHLAGLRQMMNLQADLQRQLNCDIRKMTPKMLMDYVREQTLACTDELHEALAETGWKTWAKNPHINEDAMRDELIDAWLFLLNLMNIAGMTPEALYVGHAKKVNNAIKRNNDKYDGVSTKCPTCRRAFDNDAVDCRPGYCDATTVDVPRTIDSGIRIGSSPRMRDTV